jgi:ribosomal protein S18 acetylase RimI-like enzyme
LQIVRLGLRMPLMKDQVKFRAATVQDSLHLAALLDSASRGLVLWLWSTMAAPGESVMEFGRDRIKGAEESPSHFSKWTIATIDDEIAGAFAAYPLTDPYKTGDVLELPEFYKPMLELESLAVGTWYIMTLSVFPEFRNRGLGTAMLEIVESMARQSGYEQLSIMLVSDNVAALRLYNRFGFRELHRRQYIRFPGSHDTGDWLLLTKDI